MGVQGARKFGSAVGVYALLVVVRSMSMRATTHGSMTSVKPLHGASLLNLLEPFLNRAETILSTWIIGDD